MHTRPLNTISEARRDTIIQMSQLKADGICKDGFVGMLEAEPIVPVLHVGLGDHILDVEIDGGAVYRDDLTGQVLDPKLVRAARQKELDSFESKHVWSLKVFEEARRRTGKPPVTVGWVDVNQGDDVNPNIRSGLVARQIRHLLLILLFRHSRS